MNRFSSAKDLTARQSAVTPGMSHHLLFQCGHKGSRTGSWIRSGIPWVCAACMREKK